MIRKPLNPNKRIIKGLLCIGLVSTTQSHADNVDNLAKQLVRLRGEVEGLQSQMDMEKQDHKNTMELLSSQMTELGVEKRRYGLAIEKIKVTLKELEQSKSKAGESDESLRPVVANAIQMLKQRVQDGLPFKTAERLSDLNKLSTEVEAGVLPLKKSLNRIWAFVEDEVRLGKENGLYQQTIDINGEKRLSDVAKIGMMMLFFKADEDTLGMAKRQGDHWTFVTINDQADMKRVESLFDSLKKQIRQGYFELPNPLES